MPVKKPVRAASAEPAPTRTRETPDVRRTMLIQATQRSIARYGYSGTTIERICEEASVSRGLINHHFGSKDELILQSYRRLCDEWDEHLHVSDGQRVEPEGVMRGLIDKHLDPAWFKVEYLSIWLGFWSAIPKSPELKKLDSALYKRDQQFYQSIVAPLIQKRRLKIDVRLQALQLMSLLDGLWLQRSLDPRSVSVDDARAVCLGAVAHLLD
jgi:TetR/AcrR family transcriptional repressor of bet genes